ncbi:hypothetical protein WMY93_006642 [Mugilogobius chulae]|uniref:Thymidine kinase n=1 Tax=Mugilogobius chulae TaxID=88201 RepID=A0AAW0PKS9_9GOBI
MDAVSANCLTDVRPLALKACVIGIDEGQFFPDTVPFAEEMANLGKIVIVAALDGTFQRKAFGNILSLVPLAESVVKLHAVCMQCYKEAAYTKRIGAEKEVEVIGGADKYQAVCRKCYGGLVERRTAPPSEKRLHNMHLQGNSWMQAFPGSFSPAYISENRTCLNKGVNEFRCRVSF